MMMKIVMVTMNLTPFLLPRTVPVCLFFFLPIIFILSASLSLPVLNPLKHFDTTYFFSVSSLSIIYFLRFLSSLFLSSYFLLFHLLRHFCISLPLSFLLLLIFFTLPPSLSSYFLLFHLLRHFCTSPPLSYLLLLIPPSHPLPLSPPTSTFIPLFLLVLLLSSTSKTYHKCHNQAHFNQTPAHTFHTHFIYSCIPQTTKQPNQSTKPNNRATLCVLVKTRLYYC